MVLKMKATFYFTSNQILSQQLMSENLCLLYWKCTSAWYQLHKLCKVYFSEVLYIASQGWAVNAVATLAGKKQESFSSLKEKSEEVLSGYEGMEHNRESGSNTPNPKPSTHPLSQGTLRNVVPAVKGPLATVPHEQPS